MKKTSCLLLGLAIGLVGVGLSGCGGPPASPSNITVADAKTTFEINEEFSISKDMKVNLHFTNKQTMLLESPQSAVFIHDKEHKKFVGINYDIDYSQFDSTRGTSYPIFVDYKDNDQNPNNNLRSFYMVNVALTPNQLTQAPLVLNGGWTYGETPIFVRPEAQFNNEAVQYYYKLNSSVDYLPLNTQNVEASLAKLDAGEYEFKAVFAQTLVYAKLECVVGFTVHRADLPAGIEDAIQIPPEVYTGQEVFPRISNTYYYTVDTSASYAWVNVGVHNVPIDINPNYKWNNTEDFRKSFTFEITEATNAWQAGNNLDIANIDGTTTKGWTVGEANVLAKVSLPVAQFGTVKYKLKTAGEENFVLIALADLEQLEAGQYTLQAYVEDSVNYTALAPQEIDFEVALS